MNEPEVIVIRGGLLQPDEEPRFATVGDTRIEMLPDETFDRFKARAIAIASETSASFVLIGGLDF